MCSARAHTHAITRKTAHAPCQPTSAPGLHCTYTKRHTARTAHRTCTKHPGSSMGLDGGLVAVARLEEQSHVRHRPLPSSHPQYLPHHLPPHSTPRSSSSPLFFCAAMEPSRGGRLLGEQNLGASDVEQATSSSSCARARQQAQAASPWASRRLDQASMQPRCRVHGLACVAAREHGGAPAPSAQRYSAPKTWHPGHLAIAVCAVCS